MLICQNSFTVTLVLEKLASSKQKLSQELKFHDKRLTDSNYVEVYTSKNLFIKSNK